MLKREIVKTYPYPVAKPYSIIIDESRSSQERLWSVPFTLYQALRIVTLPLLSQYLNDLRKAEEIPQEKIESVKSINEAVARIRCPFFNDWIRHYLTLCKHIPELFSNPFFPLLSNELKSKVEICEPFFDLRGNRSINRMEAILALRNSIAHGGQLPEEKKCIQIVDFYLPLLNFILEKFSFLGKSSLLLMTEDNIEDCQDSIRVTNLKGIEIDRQEELELDEKLKEYFKNSVVMKNERGEYIPLYPLFIKKLEDEPVYAYDGHHSIRQDEKIKEAYVYYLGVFDKKTLDSSFDSLKEKLERKKIVWSISKQSCAPWTLSDSCYDYSERTYEYMLNTKYFPGCYEVPPDMDRHFQSFIKSGEVYIGKDRDKKTPEHFISGFILTGGAGSGKTAFLTNQVEKLLRFKKEYSPVQDAHIARYSEHLTFFLRGDGILVDNSRNILFKNIVEKIGLKADDFSDFRELFKKLQEEWKKDKIKGRKFVIVLDAINEAGTPFQVFENALELIETASEYPWCKIVISMREEFFSTWYGRLKDRQATRTDPLYRLSREMACLYYIQKDRTDDPFMKQEEDHPVLNLEPLTEDMAKKVYENYQKESKKEETSLSACTSSWEDLKITTKKILSNPLMLHLYNQTYGGKKGADMKDSGRVYSAYIDSLYEKKAAIKDALGEIITSMIESKSSYLTEEDYHKIRKNWAEKRTTGEACVEVSPVELAVTEGMIRKRVDYEGGGYYFIYQKVLEYVIYRYLRDRVKEDNPEDYWVEKVKEEIPFSEYGNSFTFLFRDLYYNRRYSFMVTLVEEGGYEIAIAFKSFLEGHIREEDIKETDKELNEFVEVAGEEGNLRTGKVMEEIALEFMNTLFAPFSIIFYKGTVSIEKRILLREKNCGKISILYSLSQNYGQIASLYDNINCKEMALKYYEEAIGILNILYGLCLIPHNKEFYSDNPFMILLDNLSPEDTKIARSLGINYGNAANLLFSMGYQEQAKEYCEESIKIAEFRYKNCQTVYNAHSLALLYGNFAIFLGEAGYEKEEIRYCQKSIDILEPIYKNEPDIIPVADTLSGKYRNLAVALQDTEKKDEAKIYLEKSLDIAKNLYEREPENIDIIQGLARTYYVLGNFLDKRNEKIRCYEKAIELLKPVYEKIPDTIDIAMLLAYTCDTLGILYLREGNKEKGQVIINEAINMYILMGDYKKSTRLEYEINRAKTKEENKLLINISNIALATLFFVVIGILISNTAGIFKSGDKTTTFSYSILAIIILYITTGICVLVIINGIRKGKLREEIETVYEKTEYEKTDLPANTGDDKKELIKYYKKAMDIKESLYKEDPDLVPVAASLADTYLKLAVLMENTGKNHEAKNYYKKSLEIRKNLCEKDRENINFAEDLSRVYTALGNVSEKKEEKIKYYEEAIDILQPVYEANPDNIIISELLAGSYKNLAICYIEGKDEEKGKLFINKVMNIYNLIGDQERIKILNSEIKTARVREKKKLLTNITKTTCFTLMFILFVILILDLTNIFKTGIHGISGIILCIMTCLIYIMDKISRGNK